MKILSLRFHGVVDFLSVAVFGIAPPVLGLSGLPATLAYTLGFVHLAMTAVTLFPLRVIPMAFHQVTEKVVGPLLIVSPWILGYSKDFAATVFFVIMGGLILLVAIATGYSPQTASD